jgi:hypothetical protein
MANQLALRDELRALPDIEPDEAVWERVQSRIRPSRKPTRMPYALAAGLLLAIGVGMLAIEAPSPNGSPVEPTDASSGVDLEALFMRSRELEYVLSGQPSIPDTTERAYLYRIADLDTQLAGAEPGSETLEPIEVEELWGRRVALLESLADVRRNRAVLQPAVY